MTEKEMIEEMNKRYVVIPQEEFAGYRKIPEGAVVLTKEEYRSLMPAKEVAERVLLRVEEDKAQTRKETAREILDKVYDFGQGFFIERSLMEEDEFNGILDEVKKLFLNVVEVK